MKKIKTFFVHVGLFAIFPIYIMAQSNISFPDSNAYWHETYQWAPSPYFYNGVGTTFYTNDTVINQIVYHKLENIRLDVYCTDVVLSGPNYVGALREDTSTSQAYYIYPYDSEEFLFFDFSLNIGDTVPPCYYTDFLVGSIVTEMDTIVTLDGIVRKRWFFLNDTTGRTSYIIEGIGNSFGLLNPIDFCFETCNRLLCFEKDSSILWINPWNVDCSIPSDTCVLSNVEVLNIKGKYEIYPNPVVDKSILSLKTDTYCPNLNYCFELLDVFGNSVMKGIIESNLTQILTPDIKGVYFLRITDYNKISITKKIIVK